MRKALLSALAPLLLSIGAVSYAQEPPSQKPQQDSSAVTVKGCLTKGPEAQQYIVTEDASGEKVMFGGSAKLDEYVNQTVELTGRIVERGGQSAFQPQSIKTVSSSCKGPAPKK